MTEHSVPALEVTDLVVDYRGIRRGDSFRALHGVSFRLAPGEFAALVGESGSGKTTLANAVLGLLPSTAEVSGGIALSGRQVVGASERALRGVRGRLVGLVPQDPGRALNPVRTIFAQIREIFDVRGDDLTDEQEYDRVIELLRLVEIDNPEQRLRQYPHQLSGGLKQRILIAIAFGLNPNLIVADEPTSALDVTVQQQVLTVLQRLAAEQGTAILFVTHDIALATDFATRVIVAQRGELVENAPVERIVTQPASDYAARLVQQAVLDLSPERALARPVPAGADDIVVVRNLSKVFQTHDHGALRAVEDLSFRVRRGTTVAIVGESGSGKSTTARLILGLAEPTSGSIEVDGRQVAQTGGGARREYWRHIQLVHQNPDSSLDPLSSIHGIIAEPLRAHRVGGRASRATRVQELLDRVGLPQSYLRKRPGELSGGQRQRVAIARALALNTPVLVLDEALSALDVITQSQVIDLLDELQRALGLTYLFISHDLSVVRRISDRVVVLRRGRKVEENETEALFRDPRDEYTRLLLDAVPGKRHLASLVAASAPIETAPIETAPILREVVAAGEPART